MKRSGWLPSYTGESQYEVPDSPVVPTGWKIVQSKSTGEVRARRCASMGRAVRRGPGARHEAM